VVTDDVPDYALMLGNPARQKGWMCSCGVRLAFHENNAKCQACGGEYQNLGKEIIKNS